MKAEEWESLAGNPGWEALKRYLLDYRASIGESMMEGNIPPDKIAETTYRCQYLKDLANIDYQTISDFYRKDEPQELK